MPDIEELRKKQEDDHKGVWEKFLYKHRDKEQKFSIKDKQENRARKAKQEQAAERSQTIK